MIYIGKYDEFSPGRGYDSIKNHFVPIGYANKEKIVEYLMSGSVDMVSAELPKDVLTGQVITGEKLGMSDGKFAWWNTLAYYVEKYNLRLPEEFENHILKSTMQ